MNELVQKLAPSAFQPPSDALNARRELLNSETIPVPFQCFNELDNESQNEVDNEFDLQALKAI